MKTNDISIVDDHESFSIGLLILKVSRAVNYMYHQELATSGITPPQAGILWVLSRADEVSQTEVVRALMLDKANVSALVRKLKSGGYMKVRQSSHDGRKSLLSLTPKGKEIMKRIEKIDKKISAEIEKNFPAADLKKIRSFFGEILRHYI